MSGTQISDMTFTASLPSGSFVPVIVLDVITGLNPRLNYIYDIGTRIAEIEDAIADADANILLRPTFAQLAASGGSALLGFVAAGAGAVALTAQTKMRQIVNAADYGFAEANTGAQNATALTAAINAFGDTYGTVYISPGEFTLNTVSIPSNVTIQGAGMGATIIVQGTITNTGAGYVYGVFYCMAASSTTYIENVTFRDFTIQGPDITTPIFSQFVYLIACSGIRSLLVERVAFIGFKGDGLFLGGNANNTVPSGASDYRHNYDPIILECVFDGINRENRNGISVLDGTGVKIKNCTFRNCTKPTMPGAIDIEPSGYAGYVVADVEISGNRFENCGGSNGAISIFIPSAVTAIPTGFRITNNYVDGNSAGAGAVGNGFYINFDRTFTATSTSCDIVIDGHHGQGGVQPYQIYSARGVTITDTCQFNNYTTLAAVGSTTAGSLVRDSYIGGRYILCGSALNQYGITVGYADYVQIAVKADRCGYANVGYAPIVFTAGAVTSNITIQNCTFIAAAGQTIAIGVAGTLTPTGNRSRNNVFNGMTSQFTAQDQAGTAVLVAGVVVVPAPGIAAATNVFAQRNTDGGTPGCSLSITRSVGTSVTFTSKRSDGTTTETSDTSTIAYQLRAVGE